MSQKTPISLMNELAKANNLEPEYKVIEEKGPAHKKTFRVELQLGEVGTWEGSGESIKKAKHEAAGKGLENCGLCIPEKITVKVVNLTPTVELNGLAMKLGKATQYKDLPPKPLPSHTQGQFPGPPQRQMNPRFRGVSNIPQDYNHMGYSMPQRPYGQYNSFMYPRQAPRMMRVSLTVGDQEFVGEGRDKQQARHNAAKKAIELLREELQQKMLECDAGNEETKPNNTNAPSDTTSALDSINNKDPKSEISLVYEIATQRKLLVDFSDINNIGPAHMKKFHVRATVGQFVTEGEGLRKKDAKKDAAVKMLQELKNLPEIPEAELKRQKNGHYSRRSAKVGNRRKPKSDLDPMLNPISILGQILQGRHEPAPVYSLVEEKGHLSKKEFVLQVTVGNHKASGSGPNKKTAKKNAAEAMLELMGFRPTKEEKRAQQDGQNGNETSDDSGNQLNSLSRQLKPGLLPMVPELAKQFGRNLNPLVTPATAVKEEEPEQVQGILNRAPGAPVGNMGSSSGKAQTKCQRLTQLAEGMGFRVQFTNFPQDVKGSKEFSSLVNVSATPPLMCYGSGFTPEIAEEDAANNALKSLLSLHLEHNEKSPPSLTQISEKFQLNLKLPPYSLGLGQVTEQINGNAATVPVIPEPNDSKSAIIAKE